ncbi:hypothetical protein R1flu_021708 [Riccia fluitans]|uniref:Secreted protein n=1 Tax=Riccia fluitans TaxID=41844 RepID=A0ABD1ZQ54_9MARC
MACLWIRACWKSVVLFLTSCAVCGWGCASSEFYTGWLTLWGEEMAHTDPEFTAEALDRIKYNLDRGGDCPGQFNCFCNAKADVVLTNVSSTDDVCRTLSSTQKGPIAFSFPLEPIVGWLILGCLERVPNF